MSDFLESVKRIRRSVPMETLVKYEEWNKEYGDITVWPQLLSCGGWPGTLCTKEDCVRVHIRARVHTCMGLDFIVETDCKALGVMYSSDTLQGASSIIRCGCTSCLGLLSFGRWGGQGGRVKNALCIFFCSVHLPLVCTGTCLYAGVIPTIWWGLIE